MDANTSDLPYHRIATDYLVEFNKETSFSTESASYVEAPSIPTDNLEFKIGSHPFVPSTGKASILKSLSDLCASSLPSTSLDAHDYDDWDAGQWIAQVARTRKTKVCSSL